MKAPVRALIFSLFLLHSPAFAAPLEMLLQDGTTLRPAGIDVPAAYEEEAQELLTSFKTPRLQDSGKTDRYGRKLAHIFLDERWAQGELLKNGLARVQTTKDDPTLAAEMYALENQARREKRGLWSQSAYAIRTPDDIEKFQNSFQIMEGIVLDTAERRGRVYLNFGPDWKTDFTVSMPASVKKQFPYDPLTLKGKKIRIRGWVENYNGPMIELTHPEQLESLEP